MNDGEHASLCHMMHIKHASKQHVLPSWGSLARAYLWSCQVGNFRDSAGLCHVSSTPAGPLSNVLPGPTCGAVRSCTTQSPAHSCIALDFFQELTWGVVRSCARHSPRWEVADGGIAPDASRSAIVSSCCFLSRVEGAQPQAASLGGIPDLGCKFTPGPLSYPPILVACRGAAWACS